MKIIEGRFEDEHAKAVIKTRAHDGEPYTSLIYDSTANEELDGDHQVFFSCEIRGEVSRDRIRKAIWANILDEIGDA